MIHLINVKNPFDVREKKDSYVPCTGGPVSSYHIPAGGVYHYAINGKPVEPDAIPVDGDEIVIMPYVGKKFFGWILTLGITIALGMITGGLGFAAGWSIGVRIGVGMALSAIGGLLTNKLTPVPKVDVTNTEQSNTYGWGGAQTITGQGYCLPVLYGRMKTGGIMLQRHVVSDGEKQYLNILYCLAEGVIDSIEDIKLNGNPIENYSGVTVAKRYGTNNQSVIKNFNDSYADTPLAYELNASTEWSHETLQGNMAEGLEITLGFPQGLFYSNDSGGMSSTWVKVEARYKRVGDNTWTNFDIPAKIEKKTNAAFFLVYRVLDIPAGQYEVEVRCTEKAGTSIRHANKVQWQNVTQIIYDDFKHPGKALLGIKALATDQLSGNDPQMTCVIERNNVYVWNPAQNAYVEKPAKNPAWAAYDIMHQCRDFNGTKVVFGAKASQMDYYAFEAWASVCSSSNLEFHYLFDSPMRTWDAVCYPSRVGRGSVFMVGTRITCVADFASNPVQLFSVSNVKKDSFREEFLEMSQRANAIEISFMNKDKSYERDVLTVYADDYDTSQVAANPTQIELMGCVSVEQAYHYARWKLRENRYEIRTVTFEAFVDAIACKLGDVVYVQSDVTLWGDGGRVEAVNGNVVTLDHAVDTSYTQIMVRNQQTDEIKTASITAFDGNKVTVSSASGISADAVFAVGKTGQSPKKVRVLNIEKSHTDETRTITAVEYYDELYAADTSVVPQLPLYDSSVPAPKNLALTWEVFSSGNGNVRYLVHCTWINPKVPNAIKLEISKNGGPWVLLASLLRGTNTYEFDAEPDAIYQVRVYAENSIGRRSNEVYAAINMAESYQPGSTPQNIKTFTRYRELKDGINRYDLVVQWKPDGLRAQVYYKTNHVQAREMVIKQGQNVSEIGYGSAWTYGGEGVNQIVIPQAIVGDTYRIAICTADNTGVYTNPDAAVKIDYTIKPKSTTPNTPDGFDIVFGDECVAFWNEVSNADIDFYEIRTDTAAGKNEGMLVRTSDLSAVLSLTSRTGRLYLYAKGLLYYSAPAILDYSKTAPPKPQGLTLTPKLGGFALVVGAIPSTCNGLNIYIDGAEITLVHTENNTYNHACDAGIYDVVVAYTDYFGEGASSDEERVTVKATVDSALLEQQAVTKEKLSAALQGNIDTAIQSALDIISINGDITTINGNISSAVAATNGIITELNKAPGSCGYTSISTLKTTADSITATVAQNKTTQDGVNTTLGSQISQNASGISAVVANLNQGPGSTTYGSITQLNTTVSGIQSQVTQFIQDAQQGMSADMAVLSSQVTQNASDITTIVSNLNASASGNTYAAISQLKQQADGISSTVTQNKTTQDGVNTSVASRLTQNENSISAVITNLGSTSGARTYTAIQVMQDGIASKVSQNDVSSWLQQDHTGFYIKGSLIKIDGTTVIGNNIITGNMIQSNAISADKINVSSLSAICATIGTLRTATTGARLEVRSNQIRVYDSNNVLRVRMGVW